MLELATAADRSGINALARQVHEMHVAWRPDIFRMPEELYPADRFADCVRNRELYAAKLNGIVVGYVLLKIKLYDAPGHMPRRVMVVDELCVEKTLRGHGIGTRMVSACMEQLRLMGINRVALIAFTRNEAGNAFWRKIGWTEKSAVNYYTFELNHQNVTRFIEE